MLFWFYIGKRKNYNTCVINILKKTFSAFVGGLIISLRQQEGTQKETQTNFIKTNSNIMTLNAKFNILLILISAF